MQLNVGDSVGQINKTSAGEWKLYEDKINKITVTKKHGRRYFTKSVFYPLDADDERCKQAMIHGMCIASMLTSYCEPMLIKCK